MIITIATYNRYKSTPNSLRIHRPVSKCRLGKQKVRDDHEQRIVFTAMITTIDLDGLYGRSWDHESLLRRPTPESSRGCRAAWHVQVRDRPPVLHQPLLGQALHQTRRPRGASYPKEGRRKAPHSGRDDAQAPRGGRTRQALGHHLPEAQLPGKFRRKEHKRAHHEEAPKAYGLQPKKRTVGALERDEWRRATWRVTVARSLDACSRFFVDEMGTNTSLSPIYGWSKKGQRAYGSVPRNRGRNTTVLASMSVEGMGPSMAVEGATTARVFETYVERVLAPTLRKGQVVVMDNLSAHKGERVRELIEDRGCELLYLPSYSPDLNPIEEAFSKIKGLLRKAQARSREALLEAIGAAISAVSDRDALGFFEHSGYRTTVQLF